MAMQYTLAQLRDGTGFPAGARFVMVGRSKARPAADIPATLGARFFRIHDDHDPDTSYMEPDMLDAYHRGETVFVGLTFEQRCDACDSDLILGSLWGIELNADDPDLGVWINGILSWNDYEAGRLRGYLADVARDLIIEADKERDGGIPERGSQHRAVGPISMTELNAWNIVGWRLKRGTLHELTDGQRYLCEALFERTQD